jgi:hypothetical protein
LESSVEGAAPGRVIVIGSHSRTWRALAGRASLLATVDAAMGHAAAASFQFAPSDRVWVLSYSRQTEENRKLLELLRAAGVQQICYVSSSSVIACRVTRCYGYPRVKEEAERAALATPGGRVLTLGLMYDDAAELPGGDNIACRYDELADFMRDPVWTDAAGQRRFLFHRLRRPFSGRLEAAVYALYDRALNACGAYPCLLRPVDFALRLCGWRWYGYVRLSNRLWYSTISS